ncbi:glycoside hydrolase family 73 protein [Streptococcus suis]
MVWCSWGKVVVSEQGTNLRQSSNDTLVQTSKNQQLFINSLVSAAKTTGLVPSVVMAQAILESAWGTSQLATQGNNLFGIKADASWKGKTISKQTTEFRNGKAVQETAHFRAYNTVSESIQDYSKFFTSSPWRTQNYRAYTQAKDYQTAIAALQKSGYATDPKYGEKLLSLIQRYGLNKFDN